MLIASLLSAYSLHGGWQNTSNWVRERVLLFIGHEPHEQQHICIISLCPKSHEGDMDGTRWMLCTPTDIKDEL